MNKMRVLINVYTVELSETRHLNAIHNNYIIQVRAITAIKFTRDCTVVIQNDNKFTTVCKAYKKADRMHSIKSSLSCKDNRKISELTQLCARSSLSVKLLSSIVNKRKLGIK